MKAEAVVTEVYLDVEKLIYKTVSRFIARHGGDFEEYVAEANVVFLNCYRLHDPARGMFSTLLVTAINNRLINFGKNELRYNNRYGSNTIDASTEDRMCVAAGDIADDSSGGYDFGDLGNDARTVLRLVLTASGEFRDAIIGSGKGAKDWRKSLKKYLLIEMGFSTEDISNVFTEIGAVLAS